VISLGKGQCLSEAEEEPRVEPEALPRCSGVARILKLPGHRNCTLAKAVQRGASVSESARSAGKKKFSLHFSDTRMGSHGTFVVSWLTWRRTELALFVLTLLHGTWHCTVDKI